MLWLEEVEHQVPTRDLLPPTEADEVYSSAHDQAKWDAEWHKKMQQRTSATEQRKVRAEQRQESAAQQLADQYAGARDRAAKLARARRSRADSEDSMSESSWVDVPEEPKKSASSVSSGPKKSASSEELKALVKQRSEAFAATLPAGISDDVKAQLIALKSKEFESQPPPEPEKAPQERKPSARAKAKPPPQPRRHWTYARTLSEAYEALGVDREASEPELQTALEAQIRRTLHRSGSMSQSDKAETFRRLKEAHRAILADRARRGSASGPSGGWERAWSSSLSMPDPQDEEDSSYDESRRSRGSFS